MTNSHAPLLASVVHLGVMSPQQCQRFAWTAIVDDTPEIKLPVRVGDAQTEMPIQRPASSWPPTTHLEFAALPTAVPCARMHAKAVALEWDCQRWPRT